MDKVIKNFQIEIGSSLWDRSNPFIYFMINERVTSLELKEFKKIIDTIVASKGDRSKKAYEAFERFQNIFFDLLHPYIDRKLGEPNEQQ